MPPWRDHWVLDNNLKPLLEEFGAKGILLRPHNFCAFHISLIGTKDGDDDFHVLIELEGLRCQYEGAFFTNIFDGTLEVKTIDGNRDLPAADSSFNFPFFTHAININGVAENLNWIIHFASSAWPL